MQISKIFTAKSFTNHCQPPFPICTSGGVIGTSTLLWLSLLWSQSRFNYFLCLTHKFLLAANYLLHLVLITVHDADAEHELLCIIIIKDAVQVIAKAWWGGAVRNATPTGLASQSLLG